MDKITKQLISDFLISQQISSTDEPSDFEKFCNYSVISTEYNKTFDIETVATGSGNDTGIDGIGIIVNGHLVDEADEIDDLLGSNGYLDITFIFIQAKTSSSFDTKEMHSFYFGVTDFFSEQPKLPRNEEITKATSISDYLFSKASEFKENPKCKTYYITTGVVNDNDRNIIAVKEFAEQNLRSLNLFDEIVINNLGATGLGKLYRKSKNPISATFNFTNKVTLSDIDGINQSYFGIIPFSEFRKIIMDENENMHGIFNDNVRDFQGSSNPVNKNIAETLSGETPNLFSVLNNGVAIVANTIKTSGNTFTITDYQIVNGCQTTNVLYEHRHIDCIDQIEIPLRLIVTDDEDVKGQITVSTNNQTAIKKEQLAAMSDFQKNLEHYYASISGEGKLFYERRSKQYNSDRNVTKRKIVTIPIQIKSFSSIFNQNPHLVTSYFGRLVKNIGESGSKIFESNHQYSPYYLSGLIYYRLDSLFNNGDLDKKYKKIKYYICMLVPLVASDESFPPLDSQRKTEKYCDPIITQLNTPEKCKEIFHKTISIIESSSINISDKQALKSKNVTERILQTYKELK